MSSQQVDQVLVALEKLANADGFPLKVHTYRKQDSPDWYIVFGAGNAMVETTLRYFAVAPKAVLEPMCEQMCKQIRGEL